MDLRTDTRSEMCFCPSSPRNPPRVTGVDLRLRPLVLHDLHRAVQRAFVLVSFETLSERTHRSGTLPASGAWKTSSQHPPAFWSWWRRGGCSRTRWRRQQRLRTHRLPWGWWLCWGRPLGDSQEKVILELQHRSGVCYCRVPHTFVPVPQHCHDVEADGLVGPLFQHSGRQTLIGPLQSWEHISNISYACRVLTGCRRRNGGGRTLPWVLMISLTPWKNPRYFGFGDVWSWMNLTWS